MSKKIDITIAIPTVNGREHHLERTLAAYEANTSGTFEVLTYLDLPGTVFGWQLGAEAARGRYIHMAADDIEVMPGWDEAAIKMADTGRQPMTRFFNPDGSPWRPVAEYDPHTHPDGTVVPASALPFIRREWWKHITPLPPGMHYFADNYVTWRLDRVGIPTVVCRGYDVVHHWAAEHRGGGWTEDKRMAVDHSYINTVAAIISRGEAELARRVSA